MYGVQILGRCRFWGLAHGLAGMQTAMAERGSRSELDGRLRLGHTFSSTGPAGVKASCSVLVMISS